MSLAPAPIPALSGSSVSELLNRIVGFGSSLSVMLTTRSSLSKSMLQSDGKGVDVDLSMDRVAVSSSSSSLSSTAETFKTASFTRSGIVIIPSADCVAGATTSTSISATSVSPSLSVQLKRKLTPPAGAASESSTRTCTLVSGVCSETVMGVIDSKETFGPWPATSVMTTRICSFGTTIPWSSRRTYISSVVGRVSPSVPSLFALTSLILALTSTSVSPAGKFTVPSEKPSILFPKVTTSDNVVKFRSKALPAGWLATILKLAMPAVSSISHLGCPVLTSRVSGGSNTKRIVRGSSIVMVTSRSRNFHPSGSLLSGSSVNRTMMVSSPSSTSSLVAYKSRFSPPAEILLGAGVRPTFSTSLEASVPSACR